MSWIDITRPVDETLMLWPNRLPPVHEWEKRIADGHHCNISTWQMNAHSGTHIDAPLHFVEGGAAIDEIDPDAFIGNCLVIDMPAVEPIDEPAARAFPPIERLLIRSAHSRSTIGTAYPPHGALMTPDAARVLLGHGLLLIGTDRLSVDDSSGSGYALHQVFLGAGCVIVEGLSLTGAPPGRYRLYAAPLRLTGTEASPCRALLEAIPPVPLPEVNLGPPLKGEV